MNATSDRRIFDIGDFRIDGAQRRLFDRANEPVPLTARAFDVLMFMVQRPGELLDKASLIRAVWPDTIVEENNLTQCVFTLRRAFGETAGEHRYIVTVPGRGYQFVAPVRAVNGDATDHDTIEGGRPPETTAPPPRNRAVRFGASAAALGALVAAAYLFWPRAESGDSAANPTIPAPAPASIVVLPFADLSASKDMEYFADGIAEELSNSLAKFGNLRVIGRRSAFAFKGKNDDARTIGAKLKVGHILEGSVRKQGNQVRISAELSRAADGVSLWSETYDRKLDDVLDIQSAIAREVVAALGPVVRQSTSSSPAFLDARLTRNADAYTAYLRGVYFYRRQTIDDLPRAREEFERAIELDQDFALAHAWLARTFRLFASRNLGDVNAHRSSALASLDRATKLDPAVGDLWWVQMNFVEGDQMPITMRASNMERALAKTPGDAEIMYWVGRNYMLLGRRTDALKIFERAYQLDPFWLPGAATLAWSSYTYGQDRKRFFELADEIERISPMNSSSLLMRAAVAMDEGRVLDWDRWVTKALEASAVNHPLHCGLSFDYSELGLKDAALHHSGIARKLAPENAAGWYDTAHILLYSGDIAAARPFVEEARTKMPGDFQGQLAESELQYFTGHCAGQIKSVLLAMPRLDQPAAALNLMDDPAQLPPFVWCLRKEGNAARADEITRIFKLQFALPFKPGFLDGVHARMAAANGDRKELLAHLRRLAASKAVTLTFVPHEPLIQPYLHDAEVKALLDKLEARRAEWRKLLPLTTTRVKIPEGVTSAEG